MKNQLSAVIVRPFYPPFNFKAYFFRADEYIRYDIFKDRADELYPKKIKGYWPGVWAEGIDSAVAWPNNKVYFFKGSEYIRYDFNKDKADPGYPKKISDFWPGLWKNGIDAAVVWNNGKAYFFKGSEYIRYDIKKDKADPGYPKPISGNWPGLWSSGINSATLWNNGKAYFFKDNEYIRYDLKKDKTDPGYPKPISGNWPGIWEIFNFNYSVLNVPDIDQEWSILPKGGVNHCVPTSIYNWLKFFNDKGSSLTYGVPLPFSVMPGYNRDNYNIFLLGDKMDIDPERGTSHDDAFDGLLDWCNKFKFSARIIGITFLDGNFPNRNLIKNFLIAGGYLTLCYGRWKRVKKGSDEIERDGGHCVTLVELKESGSKFSLSFHNPASNDPNTSQSPVKEWTIEPKNVIVKRNGKSYEGLLISDENDTLRIFDSVIGIIPSYAWAVDGPVINWERSDLSGDTSGNSGFADLPFNKEPTEMVIHPVFPWIALVGDPDSGNIWQYDRNTEKWSVLAQLEKPAERFVFGGVETPSLFVSQGATIKEFHHSSGKLLKTKTLKSKIDGMAWDKNTKQLVLSDSDSKKLIRLDQSLRLKSETDFKTPIGKGKLNLHINPVDGSLYASRMGSSKVASMNSKLKQVSSIPEKLMKLKNRNSDFQMTQDGNFIASVNGKFMMFDKLGEPIENHPFSKMKTGKFLKMSESWENIRGLGWRS